MYSRAAILAISVLFAHIDSIMLFMPVTSLHAAPIICPVVYLHTSQYQLRTIYFINKRNVSLGINTELQSLRKKNQKSKRYTLFSFLGQIWLFITSMKYDRSTELLKEQKE